LDILHKFYENIEKEGWPNVEFLEKSFTAKIGDYPFKGAIDRIDSLPDGSWEVVDYKTGETPANFYYQNKKQLLLYKIAIEDALGKKVNKLTFYYLKSGEKKSFEATDKDLEKFKTETVQTVKKICSGDFSANPGMLCGYCDFRGICEWRK
jgi:RecB family exonuclease